MEARMADSQEGTSINNENGSSRAKEIPDVKGAAKMPDCIVSHSSNLLNGIAKGVPAIPNTRAGRPRLDSVGGPGWLGGGAREGEPRGSPLKAARAESQNPLEPLVAMIADAVVERLVQAQRPSLLTIREVAADLRRSERWVRMEIAAGRMQCVREGHSRPRITREELSRWIEHRNGRG